MAAALARGSRITGAARQKLAVQVGQRYAGGESIRAIAEETGRSFGFVHGLVKESGVTIRSRGGATRGAAATATPARTPAAAQEDPAQGSRAKKAAKSPKGTKPAKDKSDQKASAKLAEAKSARVKKSKGGKSQKASKGTKTRS